MTANTLTVIQKNRPRRRPGSTMAYILMSVFLLYFLIPLIWLFIASTKTNAGLFSSFGLWFDKTINIGQNLKDLFARDNGAFGLWIRNTAVYAIDAALGSSLISALAGYAFAQYRFKGRNLLFGIVLASVFVPATAFAVPLYLLESKTGLSNSLLAVILPSLVNPFGVYLMRIYTEQAISQDLIDAARVDGAGEFRIFVTIVFRLIAPGFVTVFLFAFVGAWNNYFLPLLVLSKMNLYPLTVGLAYWSGLATQPGNAHVLYILVIMGSVVAILPLMIVFLFLQRFWQEGLSLGSIRG
jgi:multiple sugar transport system permease protein